MYYMHSFKRVTAQKVSISCKLSIICTQIRIGVQHITLRYRRGKLRTDQYAYIYIYNTWKKVGTLATGCRRQGAKIKRKCSQNDNGNFLVAGTFEIFSGMIYLILFYDFL